MFFVFSLPRSRSFWLSKFLSYRWKRCGHETALKLQHPRDLAAAMEGMDGTVETGSIVGWQTAVDQFPNARLVVVKRPLIEVCRSFERLGIVPNLLDLGRKQYLLDELSQVDEVLTIQSKDLSNPSVARQIFEYCLGDPFDVQWWESLIGTNLQIDIRERIAFTTANTVNLAILKALAQPPRIEEGDLLIAEEPFQTAWPDAKELAQMHFSEVGEFGRKFELDVPYISALCSTGQMVVFCARKAGRLVGYITWQLSFDPECYGTLQASQGFWYADPDCPKVGSALFDYSMKQLERASVQYAWPHHTMVGRGAELGKFFERREAEKSKVTYFRRLGCQPV